jgi:hypothetical protein
MSLKDFVNKSKKFDFVSLIGSNIIVKCKDCNSIIERNKQSIVKSVFQNKPIHCKICNSKQINEKIIEYLNQFDSFEFDLTEYIKNNISIGDKRIRKRIIIKCKVCKETFSYTNLTLFGYYNENKKIKCRLH